MSTMVYRRIMVVLAILATSMFTAPAEAETALPSVSVTSRAPVAISGAGFSPSTPLNLVVRANGARLARLVSTTSRGTFAVRFPASRIDRCASVTIRVTANGNLIAAKVIESGCMTQMP